MTRSLKNWKNFKKVVKNIKRTFFDMKIQEVANKSHGPWELINWISRCKLPAIKAIKYDGHPCLSPESLWDALYSIFNTTLNCQVDLNILSEIDCKPTLQWYPFSKEDFKQVISKCNGLSAPGPNKLMWCYLKSIVNQDDYLINIINIANSCFNLGHWPNYFKYSSTIIIPKPNKTLYDQPKAFRPIFLLNTLGKLIEKVIAERLQFTVISNNFIHLSQLCGLKFKSTMDAGVALTHIVWSEWVKGKTTSTLAFDISQFSPFLNHRLLTLILEKAGLESKVSSFFANYLVKKKTNYIWNDLQSPVFEVNVGVGQGSALSPILSALYLTLFLYILEKCLKNLKIPISTLLFVDDSLIIAQNKSLDISNSHLFCSYNVLSKLLDNFSLVIEHAKTENFHFNRSHGIFNPPPLDLLLIGGSTLCSKDTWKYLGFIFDRKLIFHQHIDHYLNKAICLVKCMKLLGNLS